MSREKDALDVTLEELDRRLIRKEQIIGALAMQITVAGWLVKNGGKEDQDLMRVMEAEVNRIRREGA